MSVRQAALPVVHAAREHLEVVWFLLVVLGIGWPLMLVSDSAAVLALAAWVPGIAAILLTRWHGGGVRRRLGIDRLGWPDAYLFAIWVPVLFVAGRIAVTVAFGAGRLDDDVGGLHFANGAPPDGYAIQGLVAAITLGPFANMLVLVGSELGWRAYLLPRLARLGAWPAIAFTSLLWWLWQLPTLLGPSRDRWPFEIVSSLFWCLLVGEILGWLWFRTRSVWAPALFSGAIGATAYLPGALLRDVVPDAAAATGPAALIVPALVVLAIRWRCRAGEIDPGH